MSKYNLKLRKRNEIIKVREVVKKILNHSVEPPGIVIKDDQNREHYLAAVDFPSYDWEKIKVGTIINIEIEEKICGVKIS